MRKYSELQVGITVVLSIVVLVFGVLWFKGFAAGRDTYGLDVYMSQASGLAKGDAVEVAGVVQGTVESITYEKGRARLHLSIKKEAEIYSDARVSVANFGLMGQKFVAIDPGTPGNPVLDGSVPLEGRYESGIGEMLVMVSQSVEVMNRLAVRIDAFMGVVDSAGGAASVANSLRNVDRATADLAELTSTTKKDLRTAIANFNQGASELNSLLKDKGPTLRSTIDNFHSASGRVDSLTSALSEVSRDAKALLDKASSKDGNVGALLEDRELYNRLLATVSRTDSLLLDITRHPRKYFKFSVF